MASFHLTRLDRLPAGTEVDAYDPGRVDHWYPLVGASDVQSQPPGAVVETQTMTNTGATFSALPVDPVTNRRRYLFAAEVAGQWAIVAGAAEE